ncbi:hypothetical protein HK104_003940 [Borealophlyctis nickersoniae]|nr:hypothetical protein HK104_003940 [Borealophlyctis nickersoniae]
MSSSPPPITIRPATESDVPELVKINTHYVLNSVATFSTVPPTNDDFLKKLANIHAQRLPFLVATPADSTTTSNSLWGYAYASQFRIEKGAYYHTAEITIYLSADAPKRAGVGRTLLTALLDALKAGETAGFRDVREVLAVISVDEWGPGKGNLEFYGKMGFVDAGVIKKVGRKFGHWIDVQFMQYSIPREDTPVSEAAK